MSLKTDEDLLRDYFGTYGELKEVHVMKDTYNRESKGYGFVTFSSEDGYEKCLDENPHTIDGKLVSMKKNVFFFKSRPPFQVEKKGGGGCQRFVCQKREFAARSPSCEVSRCES